MSTETDLLLKKKSGGLFAPLVKDYELIREGSICGVLGFQKWNDVEIVIDQMQYSIRSESKATWILEQRGVSFAFCKRHGSGPKQEFEIEFDDRVWRLKPSRQKLVLGI